MANPALKFPQPNHHPQTKTGESLLRTTTHTNTQYYLNTLFFGPNLRQISNNFKHFSNLTYNANIAILNFNKICDLCCFFSIMYIGAVLRSEVSIIFTGITGASLLDKVTHFIIEPDRGQTASFYSSSINKQSLQQSSARQFVYKFGRNRLTG